jgi:hypothetical protein
LFAMVELSIWACTRSATASKRIPRVDWIAAWYARGALFVRGHQIAVQPGSPRCACPPATVRSRASSDLDLKSHRGCRELTDGAFGRALRSVWMWT